MTQSTSPTPWLDTLIIYNDVVHYYTNPFRHAAIATTGHGLHSHGNNPDRAQHTNYSHASVTKYLAEQAKIRYTILVRIKTTPSQEKAINRYMDSLANKSTTMTDNSAMRTSDALRSAGLNVIRATFPETVNEEAIRSLHGTESRINKGELGKAENFKSFDPNIEKGIEEGETKAAEMIGNAEHSLNPKPQ